MECSIRFKLSALLTLLLLSSFGACQSYFTLPGAAANGQQGAVNFHFGGTGYSYAPGIGWIGLEPSLTPPRVEGGQLYLAEDVLSALGIALPKLTGVRSSGGGTVRVVFDFSDIGAEQLEPLRRTGRTTASQPLRLGLPRVLLPQTLPTHLGGLTLTTTDTPEATMFTLRGPPARYEVFPLRDPERLVVDLTALPYTAEGDLELDAKEELLSRLRAPRQAVRSVAEGVTLRSLSRPTLAGTSQVDLVEVAPGRGNFQVQGQSYDLRTPSDLTGSALIGINASYFDPEGGRSIGLLKQRGVLESLPSRHRAAIGFGFGRPLIDRPKGRLEVQLNGRPGPSVPLQSERVTLHTQPGTLVSSPRQGAIVVAANGRVLENKVGPRWVPAGGFVLSYLPEVRPLARVNAGDILRYALTTEPSTWRFVPEAVEAGPLLVAGGKRAYRPALEAFDTEERESNINRRTTRAALGVRPDGTVLLLVATQMTTAELVPLFLELGAEAALQLDSGGSSTLVVGGEVINRPALLQRRVATVIVYTPSLP